MPCLSKVVGSSCGRSRDGPLLLQIGWRTWSKAETQPSFAGQHFQLCATVSGGGPSACFLLRGTQPLLFGEFSTLHAA